MSAGVFEIGRYIDNRGAIRGIRVQPETATLDIGGTANDFAVGAIDAVPRAKVSGGRNSYGVNARKVTIRLTAANPTPYAPGSTISLPWFVRTTFDALVNDTTGTYNGQPVILVGTTPEKTR
jgi:hypothetical protein